VAHWPEAAGRSEVLCLQRDDAGSLSSADGQEASGGLVHGSKFASEGLQALDGDDDMLTAMARELVQNRGIGESADLLWKRVGEFLPATSSTAAAEMPLDDLADERSADLFGVPAFSGPTTLPTNPEPTANLTLQLSLF
jgi:hypothetical protein